MQSFNNFLVNNYSLIKAFHVISMVAWMAALLYLPRLFVYHTTVKKNSDASEMLKIMEYRLQKYIHFVDKCELMPLAYKVSDIVISSSIEPEAFGRVSVEAQAMEKPIIASNIGGSKETVVEDKTGFLFESGKSEALSKKIIHALNLDESTLKYIGIEGRKNVVKKFNVEKMCFSTYSEYKKIIK